MRKQIRQMLLLAAFAVMLAVCLAGCGSGSGDSGGNSGSGGEDVWPAMTSLKAMDAGDITAITYLRSTEDGAKEDTVTDELTVEDIYLRLCNVNILEETDLGTADDGLSLKIEAGEKELSFQFEGDVLVLDGPKRYEVEELGSLKNYIDTLIASADADQKTDPSRDAKADDPGDFDILKGLEKKEDGSALYLYGNDFLLTMPNNDKWDIEQHDPNSFTIYFKAGKASGYEGDLVTIAAYDPDDGSYKDHPHYQIAGFGKNVNKRFVALYPTDVRWDTNDPAQTEDYQELREYLGKIGEGAVNSPFQTEDSD